MYRTLLLSALLIFVLGCTQQSQAPKYVFPVMVDWEGSFTTKSGEEGPIGLQLIDLGNDSSQAVFWVGVDGPRVSLIGVNDGQKTIFAGEVALGKKLGGVFEANAELKDSVITGGFVKPEQKIEFKIQKAVKQSPNLGLNPPEGAVVLFDGTNLDGWQTKDGKPATWELLPEGVMEVRKHSVVSKKQVGDHKLHVEFRTPFMPHERGQGRGNSGVYVLGRYEVQVLDSYANEPADNLCGGIYKLAVPKTNAAMPPLTWQSYDITFYAPKFDENGEKIKDAEITVNHNGILIHDKVALPRPTPGGMTTEEGPEGGLYLQDHGDPVQYRNIWYLPL